MDLEAYLDPLWRPPLSLAVFAAALKYTATALVLEDPVLFTRADYFRRRQDPAMERFRRALLVGQLVFVGLAAQNLVMDLSVVVGSGPHLSLGAQCHLSAMVLAFSPNTVTAVVGAFTFGLKAKVLKDASSGDHRLCKASDKVGRVFALVMGLFYLLPLVLVGLSYGCLGLLTVSYVFIWDFLSLPWRLLSGDMGAIWVAVPVACAMLVCHVLSTALIAGHVLLFEWRYPELTQKIAKEGQRVNVMKMRITSRFRAEVIGRSSVQESPLVDLAGGEGADGLVACEANQGSGDGALEDAAEADTGGLSLSSSGGRGVTEKCILNDEHIAVFTCFRSGICLAMPLLQVSVVIAAKIFLGDGLWQASTKTFGERSWSHYIEHAGNSGLSGAVPLLWYYL